MCEFEVVNLSGKEGGIPCSRCKAMLRSHVARAVVIHMSMHVSIHMSMHMRIHKS